MVKRVSNNGAVVTACYAANGRTLISHGIQATKVMFPRVLKLVDFPCKEGGGEAESAL